MLTPDQVATFQAQGFLKSSRILDDDQVDVLREELARVMRDKTRDDIPQPIVLRNLAESAESPIWQIVNIWEASAPFQRLVSHPTIVEEVAQLTRATELRLWHDQIQFKPAETGGVNHWHQDWPYWPSIAPLDEQVTAWIALDDVDEENGCMSMVPGSHLWGNCIDFLEDLPDFGSMPKRHGGHDIDVRLIPVKKGEVHYHHGLTWHGSHGNKSGRPRRAIACHYMTEKTTFVASGNHLMHAFVEVPHGHKLQGKHFPLVWEQRLVGGAGSGAEGFTAQDGALAVGGRVVAVVDSSP